MAEYSIRIWLQGARLRTLPAAVVPVFVGSSIAAWNGGYERVGGNGGAALDGGADWLRFGLAMGVGVALQIGVNFANDYSDGKRGLDDLHIRKGPTRLVGAGLAKPGAVLTAAMLFFAIAVGCGLVLVVLVGYPLLIVGALALIGAWTYTGGPYPYGYRALGEVSVFLFFGLTATVGTTYIHIEEMPSAAWVSGAGVGLMSSAILIANNFRDIEGDRAADKRTLAVLLGAKKTVYLYMAVLLGAGICVWAQSQNEPWTVLALTGPLLSAVFMIFGRPNMVPKLGNTVAGLCLYGLGLTLAYWAL